MIRRTSAVLNATWREQGISYIKYLNVTTEALHSALKDSTRAKYERFSTPGYISQRPDGSGGNEVVNKVPIKTSELHLDEDRSVVNLAMPWYLSTFRVGFCAIYSYFAYTQAKWIFDAEDRYRRSLTWKPAVGTIFDHKIVMKRGGSSYVQYRFDVDGHEHVGDRFRSGGIHKEEMVSNPALLGAGTQLVVYYDPADPRESAIKLQTDRGAESVFLFGIAISVLVAYRAVRCETILPNLFYSFLGVNRRIGGITGLKESRTHSRQKMRYGNGTGAI